ncbi:MAG TPA: FmdB family zinc ribbon protein [Longimicrobiales bacterium]|nr:FmdB family zinc ribbon protein [Longimicrobiales bacterium]
MPLYDYCCRSCGQQFEALVRGETKPSCPACQSQELDRLLSLPGINSEATKQQALKAAQKRDRQQATERMHEQLKYEQSHDRHG